eukprot:COSAG02_NODE_2449_length_8835_cov_2.885315_1_plen_161_part_10
MAIRNNDGGLAALAAIASAPRRLHRDRDRGRGRDKGSNRDRDRDKDRDKYKGDRDRDRDRARDTERYNTRDRERDSGSSASRESLSVLLSAVRARLNGCAGRVDSLEAEFKESSWSASGTAVLISSGGLVEQIEVELTEILVLCGRESGEHGAVRQADASE